jgi:hypothetical protein
MSKINKRVEMLGEKDQLPVEFVWIFSNCMD